MKYKTLIPAILLGLSLGGSVKSDELIKAPAPIVKEYKGEKYEITNIKFHKSASSYIFADIRKKDGNSVVTADFSDSGISGKYIELYLGEKKALSVEDRFIGSLWGQDGKIDNFAIGDDRYRLDNNRYHKSACPWEFPRDSSCEKAESLAKKVQEIFDKYNFLLKDIFKKEKAKHYLKVKEDVLDKL